MRFLITGDWHIDKDTIKTRQDNIFATCIGKLGEIFQIAKTHKCSAILQPGDFFESHKANDFIKQYIIDYLKSDMANIPIYTVFGQHDLRYHSSNVNNTPLKVLHSAGVINFLGRKPLVYPQDRINIYGTSWFEDVPEIWKDLTGTNILVCHKMIVDTKIWEGQENFVYGKTFLAKNNFDLIVSGDNHKQFVIHSGTGATIGKRLLVNCGSLLRTRIDQGAHKPCVFIYDTNPGENMLVLEQIFLTIQDFNKVIKVEEATRIKAENEKLKEFVNALSVDTQLTGINYKRNVYDYISNNKDKIDSTMRTFIDDVFKTLGDQKHV